MRAEKRKEGIAEPMSRHSARGRDPLAVACRILSEILVVIAALTGSYTLWKAWGSGLDTTYNSHKEEVAAKTNIRQASTDKAARIRHGSPPIEDTPEDGGLFAYIRVPSWGRDYRLPVYESTTKTVLDKMGAGHYDDTAMPGDVGNSSYAGHNTYADLADIRLLKPGDTVYIETGSYWYRYVVNSNPKIVDQTAVGEIAADGAGVERGLTLQTCWPIMTTAGTTKRLIVHGTFDGWAAKTDGAPKEYTATHYTTKERITHRLETVSERLDTPISGVLGLGTVAMWLCLAVIGWLASRRRAWDALRHGPPAGPVTLLWRLTPGVFQSNTVVYTLTRLMPFLLLVAGLNLLFWRWGCPALDASPVGALFG